MKRVLQLVLSFCFLPFLCLPVIAAVPDITSDFIITPLTLVVSENETTATFSVCLGRMPSDDVTIQLVSSDVSELTINKTALTFTGFDYNVAQIVMVTGVDDDSPDGDINASVILGLAISTDISYSALNPTDVSVIVQDNEPLFPGVTPEVIVTPLSLIVNENGSTATFSVYLNRSPTDDVTISLISSDSTELTIDKSVLTFTGFDYDTPQVVTVTGIDDDEDDGDQTSTVILGQAVSLDVLYDQMKPKDVSVTVQDNDVTVPVGVTVTPRSLTVDESGTIAKFSVYLNSRPTDNVTIPLVVSDPSEISIDKGVLVFTISDYNIPQTIMVTGVDDEIGDGNKLVFVVLDEVVSTDTRYEYMDPLDVNVIVQDNDPFEPGVTPGVIVTPLSLIVDESGSTATFSVYLNSRPTDGVYFNLVSNDPSELSISSSILGFRLSDYNIPQIVTVTGIDDEVIDGDQIASVILERIVSTDLDYDSLDPEDVSVTVKDNDAIVNPFRIISSDPVEGAINVPWSQSISIMFSEDIRLRENFGNIVIYDGSNPVGFTNRVRGSVLILNPKRNFLSNKSYTVTITMGAVEDMLGNTLANDYSLTFTTKPKR